MLFILHKLLTLFALQLAVSHPSLPLRTPVALEQFVPHDDDPVPLVVLPFVPATLPQAVHDVSPFALIDPVTHALHVRLSPLPLT